MSKSKTSVVHLKLVLTNDLVNDLDLRDGKAEKLIKMIQRMHLRDVLDVCEGVRVVPQTGKEKIEEVEV